MDYSVPGVQIVECGRKIHEEKKTRGDKRGKGGENAILSPSRFKLRFKVVYDLLKLATSQAVQGY